MSRRLICLEFRVKFLADDIIKKFSYFSQETGFDISCKLSSMQKIYMKCQILVSWKNKKNITKLLSAELAKSCKG